MSSTYVTPYKRYPYTELDAKELANPNGNVTIMEEIMGFPIRMIHDVASKGKLKGGIILDISLGSNAYQLFAIISSVKEIYVVQMSDASLKNFNQWLKKDSGAADWSFASKLACKLEGNRQDWKEKEDQTRSLIKGVYKWDNPETAALDPASVPQVDFVISTWMLNVISKTKDDLLKNLQSVTSRLKPRGQLLLFMMLNTTFYKVGSDHYSSLTLGEKELHEVVNKAGFSIEESFIHIGVKHKNIDYSHLAFVFARKVDKP